MSEDQFVYFHGQPGSPEELRVAFPEGVPASGRLWQGGADNWTPPVMAEQLAARLPQASLTVLPGLSHYSTLAAVLPQLLQDLG